MNKFLIFLSVLLFAGQIFGQTLWKIGHYSDTAWLDFSNEEHRPNDAFTNIDTSAIKFILSGGIWTIQVLDEVGNTHFILNSSGNMGVGLSDPDELVELYKVGTQLKLSGGAADYTTFAVAADGALTITTVDVDAAEGDIILMPDGNVGINVIDPQAPLEVYVNITWTTTDGEIVKLSRYASDIEEGVSGYISMHLLDTGHLISNEIARIQWEGTNTEEEDGWLSFWTRDEDSLYQRMTITDIGNVGISTTLPDKALEINSATGANLRLTYNDADGSAANYADLKTNLAGDFIVNASTGRTLHEGTLFLKEQAEANADTAAFGQIWVNTATPNELWWTDDAGTDAQLGAASFLNLDFTWWISGAEFEGVDAKAGLFVSTTGKVVPQDANAVIVADLDIPYQVLAETCVIDQITVYYHTDAVGDDFDFGLVRADLDGSVTLDEDQDNIGNGTTGDQNTTLLAADITLSDFPYWVEIDVNNTDSNSDVDIYAVKFEGHLE